MNSWPIATRLNRITRTRAFGLVLVVMLSLSISVALSIRRPPRPTSADEFSYLLAADTFVHGRITNPTHPMWVHFESPHLIHEPTYMSKFPPGQGLVLAAGQQVFGRPIAGVWLSVALACAALWWMLRAWIPARWALCGGCLAALHPWFINWSQNYWGGAVAVAGGALLLGGVRRLVRKPQARHAFAMAAGMAILANSRPFEGFVLTALVAPALVVRMFTRPLVPARVWLRHIALPIALVLSITAGAMGWYNFRITGHALRLPYLTYQATYEVAPKFLWQSLQSRPAPHTEGMRRVQRWEEDVFLQQRSSDGWIGAGIYRLYKMQVALVPAVHMLDRLHSVNVTIVPALLLLFVLMFWRAWRRQFWMRAVLLSYVGFMAMLLLETYMFPHYAAPATGLGFLLAMQAIRHVHRFRWRRFSVGHAASATILLLLFLLSARSLAARFTSAPASGWAYERANLVKALEQQGGPQLIIVRYGPTDSLHDEWVYNDADIDHARVVWAHTLGPERDGRLMRYFNNRRAWLLNVGDGPPTLTPYPPADRHRGESAR